MVAVLNGDVDNHADIRVNHELQIAGPITTDAKVIPAVMAHHVAAGVVDLTEAFRRTVAEFEGSVAIGAAAAQHPDRIYLALRGSGQALYVGLADDFYIVASEPYGVVEETTRYVRMDGETPSPREAGARSSWSTARSPEGSTGSVDSPTTAPSCRSRPLTWPPPR
jgi:glucosamine--fructose-6-phosphate aminotransferase (isomerizing)